MYCQQRRASTFSVLSSNLLDSVCNVTFLLVLVAVFYQYWTVGRSDPYHCQELLGHGSWPRRSSDGQRNDYLQTWEPAGCHMIEYSRGNFHDCLGGRRVVFAGDSTTRQIYWAAANRLDHAKARRAMLDALVLNTKHEDLSFEAEGVSLEFIWDPWLNSSSLDSELAKFRVQNTFLDGGAFKSEDDESAGLILLGAPGLWAARHGGNEYLDLFKQGIDSVKVHMRTNLNQNMKRPTADLKRNFDVAPNQMLLAPVQVPWYDSLSYGRAETITLERVDKMNSYLEGIQPDERMHILWSYHEMTNNNLKAYEENGIHVLEGVAERKLDIALNARCNAAGVGHKYPHKLTCCMTYPREYVIQPALLFMGFVGLPLLLWVYRYSRMLRDLLPTHSVLRAIRNILLTAAWCWLTDRTQYFVKAERQYNPAKFITSCVVFLVASLLSIRRSDRQPNKYSSKESTGTKVDELEQHDQGFLSRGQSDEWKGWMQGLILIYHFYYGSQILWVYKIIRVLVSAYIFLSAYGHTTYLLRTEDFSLRRVASVIFRLNALDVLLAYMMMTDYSFYYFAPIVTFWYGVVWLTLRIYSKCNQDPVMLLVKVVISTIVTSLFILIPGPLDLFSTISRVIFRMSWIGYEARFRLSLDRSIVYFGMLTASIVHRIELLRTYQILPRTSHYPTARAYKPSLLDPALSVVAFPDNLSRPLKPVACILSVGFTIFFFILTQVALGNKVQYNIAHAYISWVPILSFVVLRNSFPVLRNYHMALPAALGRISLETFILQYHIWLGSDATAVLSTGLWDRFGSPLYGTWFAGLGRTLDFVLLTVLFLCVCIKTRQDTETLTHWLFGKERQSHQSASSGRLRRTSEDRSERAVLSPDISDGEKRVYNGGAPDRSLVGAVKQFFTEGVGGRVCALVLLLWLANLVY